MKIDKLAREIYGEFGFSTCTEEQQKVIIKKILDEVTIKLNSNDWFKNIKWRAIENSTQ